MRGNILLLLAALLPWLTAPLAWVLGRWKAGDAIKTMIAACGLTLALLIWLLTSAANGAVQAFRWDGLAGQGLLMRADGFRALYACVAGFMWLITSVFSLDYFRHEENVGRYALFTLITFGATAGLFLSDSLYSTFLFFEVMSLASYPWVAHEETPGAMRAAQTYLYIAVIGGLVTLMGLFLLPGNLAVMSYGELSAATSGYGWKALWLPALLVLFGFAAKAGSFPLHIWLPKAHPVAPAPASALLSGILTKAGVFGMLVLTCLLMKHSFSWGDLIFRLGVITMLLGAALAILSGNLKRTLACSSLSQIGFIMVGVGLTGMLGHENGLAAYGMVGHMVNHSLFKLTLFLCAGVVAMNTHCLALADVRGYGRKKLLLRAAFLCGALGISGVPLFSGYLSKSLLHEGILELIAVLEARGQSALLYRVSEYAFLTAGGMTLCYMLKLYVCLFVTKHPTRQKEYDDQRQYISHGPAIALLTAALLIPVIGLLPGVFMTGFGALSQSFLEAASPGAIAYFSGENLLGALKSILIGLLLYALVSWLEQRHAACGTKGADAARLRFHFDLEELVYRPLLAGLCRVGYWIAWPLNRLTDGLVALLSAWGGGLALGLDKLTDGLIVLLRGAGVATASVLDGAGDMAALAARRTVLSPRKEPAPVTVGSRFTCACGRFLDGFVALLNRSLCRGRKIQFSFTVALAALREEILKQARRLTRSVSFGLLMFCIGLFVTLAYLLY